MLKQYKYTDIDLKSLLHSITILVDTREQKNDHITNYFEKQGISWKSYKLSYGDYSFMIPANNKLGVIRDLYFDKDFVIERKANLEELSNNLTQGRERLENEFIRANNTKLILVIEDNKYDDIIKHKYNTQYNPKSFIASLMCFLHRYNINTTFIPKEAVRKLYILQFLLLLI